MLRGFICWIFFIVALSCPLATVDNPNIAQCARQLGVPICAPQSASEYCAGIVATGDCVKDGRSIFWQQVHWSDPGLKPYFFTGTNHKFFGIGLPYFPCVMGMNEAGLALGSLMASSPPMSVGNRQFISDGTMESDELHRYVLGTFATVSDAAHYIAQHRYTSPGSGWNTGIVSNESGIGAVVSVCNVNDTVYGHITWVNDTWAPLDNALHCEGICRDPDGNGQTIYDVWTEITTNGGSSDGDHKITWEDVCHLGAKNVSDLELGEGIFSTYGQISRPKSIGAMVAVSGDTRCNASANISWTQIGRQALVGIFMPLGASYLESQMDIPAVWTDNGGIEDYVTPKVLYATDGAGQGSALYDCAKTREILDYANSNENYMFREYDRLMDSLVSCTDDAEARARLESFAGQTTTIVLDNYINSMRHNDPPNEIGDPSPRHNRIWVDPETGLEWDGGDQNTIDSVVYDIYFGTSSDPPLYDSTPPYPAAQTRIDYSLPALNYQTQYYWKITAEDNHGMVTVGPVWSFMTMPDDATCDCIGFCEMDGLSGLTPVDVVYIVNYVYRQLDARPELADCPKDNGDWDCDGFVNPVDVVYYVAYVYKSAGAGPCDPCGP